MKKLIRKILTKFGWIDCPKCNSFIKPKFIKDWIYDPEEPPMFYHYECPQCFARTDIEPTILTENAVKKLGFENFQDYYDRIKGEI